MLNVLFLLILGWSTSSASLESDNHAVYISVVEIEQTAGASAGVLKVKVFADDLEDAIHNRTGKRFNLTENCTENVSHAADYIKDHLVINVNGKKIDYRLVGCENIDISIWLEFDFDPMENWQEFEIIGDHLMELFPTQSNVISVNYEDQKRMFRLTSSKKEEKLLFE